MEWSARLSWEMYNYCSDNVRWLETVAQNPWLRDHYLLVQHRDMSIAPLRTAEAIYRFIGETLTESVREFIKDVTRGKGGEDEEETALTVRKNSTQVVDRWKEMPGFGKFRNLRTAEAQCKTLLRLMGEGLSFDQLSERYYNVFMRDLGDTLWPN